MRKTLHFWGMGTNSQIGANMGRSLLLVFDAVSMDAQSAADIEIGREPAHVIVDPAGKLAYGRG